MLSRRYQGMMPETGCRRSFLVCAVLRIVSLCVLQPYCAATEDALCSEVEPCPSTDPPQFCNFENFESGICRSCVNVSHPAGCFDLGVPTGGQGGKACAETCLSPPEERECSTTNETCASGYSFCDFRFGETGYCSDCPFVDVDECLRMNLTGLALESCTSSCKFFCEIEIRTHLLLNDRTTNHGFSLIGSPALNISASLLVDCSQLTLEDVDMCADNAENAICLVGMDADEEPRIHFYETVWKAERSGCGAVVFFIKNIRNSGLIFNRIDLQDQKTSIPSLIILAHDGKAIVKEKLRTSAEIQMFREEHCLEACTESFPCSSSDWYCDYELGDFGICSSCEYDSNCLFRGLPERGIQECTEVCGVSDSLTFPNCKFCPKDVSGSDLGSANEDTKCEFCPENDMKYFSQEMRLFGRGITCFLVQEFFRTRDIPESDENCQLAQMFNYQCGCTGPGYAGANTNTKRAVLAWLPRAAAILSIFGSVFIIYDVLRVGRKELFNQMMLALSIFDIFGAGGYAFTSLPMPAIDYIYGSRGNEASCAAQGFFIQLGTTACYFNVSLAFYYLLVIKFGWTDHRVKKKRIWLFLAPVVVGFSLAFAGIPFYDNVILWCNNSSNWWPDIPVAVAIAVATGIMGVVCHDVYKKEKKSARWSMRSLNNSEDQSLSSRVMWQTFWYLMAFYATWPPYLALQYMWASGTAFTKYGFILFAGTAVPLQGFWNFIVYTRPRYWSKICCIELGSMRSTANSTKSGVEGTNGTGTAPLSSTHTSKPQDASSEEHIKQQVDTSASSNIDTVPSF